MKNPNVCYAPTVKYKPEWAYSLRKGVRAESFVLPFSFQVMADGTIQHDYPWKLDDDVPWLFRGMVFAQIGTAEQVNEGVPPGYVGNAALVRIRDTNGNPLTNCVETQDMVLAVGAIGQSGFNDINAAGFPFGCEIECERGGTILFDFQIPSNALQASLLVVFGFVVTAVVPGAAGNAISIALVQAGDNTPLSVVVAGNAITVNLATDGGGDVTSIYSDVAAAIVASAAASALVTVTVDPSIAGNTVTSKASTNLVGGGAAGQVTVQGTMLGCKLFEDCQ